MGERRYRKVSKYRYLLYRLFNEGEDFIFGNMKKKCIGRYLKIRREHKGIRTSPTYPSKPKN
jgi:hypothetical protein